MMQTKTWEKVEMTKGIFAKIAATILIIFAPNPQVVTVILL